MGAGQGEAILFGWVVFESREARDRANERVSSDPRVTALVEPLVNGTNKVFDPERMAYAGFRPLFERSPTNPTES
jgi:uncharacterized protein YbaA (DUF1428 family)